MKLLLNIKLRSKITLVVFFASLLIFIVAEIITYKFEAARQVSEKEYITKVEAQLISDYCAWVIKNGMTQSIKNATDELSVIPYIYDGLICDTNKNVIVAYHKTTDSIQEKIYNCHDKDYCYEGGFVHILTPILYEKEHLGYIYIRSYVNLDELRNRFWFWTCILFVLQLIFALLLLYLFHRIISNPITHLISVTKKIIARKDYNIRIEKKSYDEIGGLYDEFNNLLNTITTQTQQKQIAESALRDTFNRYKALMDNIPGVVFRVEYDKKWKIEFVGEGVVELSDGYPVEYFIGNDVSVMSSIIASEDQAKFKERLESSIGVNRVFESIYRVVTKNGLRNKWILMKGRFVYDSEQQKTICDGVLIDQTEKINGQKELQKAEKRYHDLFENLNDPAFIVDKETEIIVETNLEGEVLLGLGRDEILGKYKKSELCNNISPSHNQNSIPNLGRSKSFDFYAEVEKAGQKTIPVHVRSSEIIIGDKPHIICLVRDISDRVEYEENLKIAKNKAEESDRLKSMFLSNMSHEIRTPLNGLIGFSKLILSSNSQEETKSYIAIIDSCGKQLLRIIDDILDVSKIETNQLGIFLDYFNLNDLLEDIRKIIEEQIKRSNKTNLKFEIKKGFNDNNDIIYSDRHRLFQVIVNIASNAVKFTNEGFIHLSYDINEDGMLHFNIKDTGMGVPAEKQELIFNRFSQADSSISIKYGGSGLGLAIAKGIVEKLGGTISLTSEEGVGSEFNFTIVYTKK